MLARVLRSHGDGCMPDPDSLLLLGQAEQLRSLIKAGPAAVEAYMEPRHVVDMLQDAAGTAPTPLDKVRRGVQQDC